MKRAIFLSLVAVMSFVVVGCKEVNVVVTNNSDKLIEARVEGPADMKTTKNLVNPGTSCSIKMQIPDENLSKKYTLVVGSINTAFTINKNTASTMLFKVTNEGVEGPTFPIQE